MKCYRNWIFLLSDYFGVKLKNIFIERPHLSFLTPSIEQIQMFLNGFRNLIYENVEQFTKFAFKNQKFSFLSFLRSLWQFVIQKLKTTCFSPKKIVGQRNHSLLYVVSVLIYESKVIVKFNKICIKT